MDIIRDEFLSEEDLDLRNLTFEELITYWNSWLEQASITDEIDKYSYSHGVFTDLEKEKGYPFSPPLSPVFLPQM